MIVWYLFVMNFLFFFQVSEINTEKLKVLEVIQKYTPIKLIHDSEAIPKLLEKEVEKGEDINIFKQNSHTITYTITITITLSHYHTHYHTHTHTLSHTLSKLFSVLLWLSWSCFSLFVSLVLHCV
jgi:hypothetical protein